MLPQGVVVWTEILNGVVMAVNTAVKRFPAEETRYVTSRNHGDFMYHAVGVQVPEYIGQRGCDLLVGGSPLRVLVGFGYAQFDTVRAEWRSIRKIDGDITILDRCWFAVPNEHQCNPLCAPSGGQRVLDSQQFCAWRSCCFNSSQFGVCSLIIS